MEIVFNVNALHNPIKRQIEILDKKQELNICFQKETHFKYQDTDKLKMKGWKELFM